MINIINPNNLTLHKTLDKLLTEFKRKQVSRFAINAIIRAEGIIIFTDSRFPTPTTARKTNDILGSLFIDGLDDKNRLIVSVSSRLITNDKFSAHNEDYHKRSTIDDKKVSKWLRDYIKPYSPIEITDKSERYADAQVSNWVEQSARFVGDFVRSDRMEVMEYLLEMKRQGLEPVTDKFRKYMKEGLPHYEEWLRRKAKRFSKVHVLVNPDESVMITANEETTFYESLQQAPETIQQNIALLRMGENTEFIPEIGYVVSHNEFWIETHTE